MSRRGGREDVRSDENPTGGTALGIFASAPAGGAIMALMSDTYNCPGSRSTSVAPEGPPLGCANWDEALTPGEKSNNSRPESRNSPYTNYESTKRRFRLFDLDVDLFARIFRSNLAKRGVVQNRRRRLRSVFVIRAHEG